MKTKRIQIKDLQTGMKIKTKDQHLGVVFKTVVDKWNTVVKVEDQVRLEFENGVVLNCSANHPIMVLCDSGKFLEKNPKELTVEDRVLTEGGFTRLSIADFEQNNDSRYIDITVEDNHTFFASANQTGPMVLTHNSQGGIRNSSCTVYFPIWHYQFDDLIVLKNNQGTEETRVRHLDYAVVMSALFWRRLKHKQMITFFDPNQVPELYEAFYSDIDLFDVMYAQYETRKDLRVKVMSAEEVFKGGILKERTDTGRIYLMFTDNVQRQGPFDPKTHPIYQSNLCLTGDVQITIRLQGQSEQTISLASFVEQFELGRFGHAQVKSYDVSTGQAAWASVTNAAKTATVTQLIQIEDEAGNVIKCTPDHQIYTKNRGYVTAAQLRQTDVLCTNAESAKINRIDLILVQPTDVYDMTVPQTECFFANGILVHNCAEIVLPTVPFKSLDDEGQFQLTMDTGQVISLPGQHTVLLADGTKRKVRELTETDDIQNLLV